jgi:hypothetical protein
MQRFLLTILLVLSSVGFAKTQETTGDTTEQVKNEILTLEREKDKALVIGGSTMADFLDRHDVDDIVWTGGGRDTGESMTKAEVVAEWRSGARKIVSINHHDYRVQVYENGIVAVVTFRGNETMQRNGTVSTHQTKALEVYIKQDGVWRAIVHNVRNVSAE